MDELTPINSAAYGKRLLLANVQRHVTLSAAEQEMLCAAFKPVQVSRKTILQEQGKRCPNFYFVEAGSLRAYHTNAKGKEATIMFAIQDWWITDMTAFANEIPALISLEALEHCLLNAIDRQSLEELLQKLPKLEKFFRILFQRAYIREQTRVLDVISLPVEERYHLFLEKYPQIAEKISQKQIASYLGVTPEFLSTVKKNRDS